MPGPTWANGEAAAARFGPSRPEDIARVLRWLAENNDAMRYHDQDLVYAPQLLQRLREKRAIRYYRDAAEKIHALPEVARALKTLAKKREKRLSVLQQ